MIALDIMVADVVTVTPEATIQEVAQILSSKRISGLPVVDESGVVVGIVSEGDLLRRVEAGTEHERSWWLKLLMGRETLAAEYIKEHAAKVGDIMTRDVLAAKPDTPVTDIAALFEKNGIKRVPIIDGGKLVGIVSRANLVQALAKMHRPDAAAKPLNDDELRERVMARLRTEAWAKTSLINVTVDTGAVDLWGIVDSEAEKQALRVAIEVTPGVRLVTNNVVVRPTSTMS